MKWVVEIVIFFYEFAPHLFSNVNFFEQAFSLWSMPVTPLGFCLRVIVNKKPLNLEKTTSGVLSVIVN